MAELKTKPTGQSAREFLNGIGNEKRRADSFAVLKLMKDITKVQPKMWGPSIIGFGSYHYKYDSGREADWFLTGFSPRKQNLTLYIMSGFKRHRELMKNLGKCKTGKGCLYINKLEDIDLSTLKKLIGESVNYLEKK